MIEPAAEDRHPYDSVTIPLIWVAFLLSLALHAAALLWPLPREKVFPSLDWDRSSGKSGGSLIVDLPRPQRDVGGGSSVPAPPGPAAQAAPRRQASSAAARAPLVAPVTREHPALAAATRQPFLIPPSLAAPPIPPVPSAQTERPAPPPQEGPVAAPSAMQDLASYVEARRRARGEPQDDASPAPAGGGAPPPRAETDRERENRLVATRLGLRDTPTFGTDPHSGGGVFQIQRMGYDDAEFVFWGWNKDIKRNSRQVIEAHKGDAGDIRLAVIRKMIGIIRETEPGDFVWVSRRLGHDVTLSAAPDDNAGLEEFLMREFFGDPQAAQ